MLNLPIILIAHARFDYVKTVWESLLRQQDLLIEIRNNEKLKKFLNNNKIKKSIYIKNKLINLII